MSSWETVDFVAGRATWRRIREAQRIVNFKCEGYLQMMESRGWIERRFVAKGTSDAIAAFRAELKKIEAAAKGEPT